MGDHGLVAPHRWSGKQITYALDDVIFLRDGYVKLEDDMPPEHAFVRRGWNR